MARALAKRLPACAPEAMAGAADPASFAGTNCTDDPAEDLEAIGGQLGRYAGISVANSVNGHPTLILSISSVLTL